MSAYFCISVRLLDETYHGRADRGEPEWPPSPMRLVQALVAAAARRRGDGTLAESDQAALQWLERLAPPTIAAPTIELGTKYRLYVPDNIADKVAGTWSRGGEASIADYRTEKDVQVVQLRGADPTLHFLWPLPAAADAAVFVETLQALARRVTHLGWGVDMAAVNARVLSIAEVEDLPGHRWSPVAAGGVSRRVPIAGSLAALIRRHNAFLQRLPSPDSFAVVPPFTMFDTAQYYSPTARSHEAPARPFAAFQVLNPNGDGFRPFDAASNAAKLAGMARHAVAQAARASWGDEDLVNRYVLGHGEARGAAHVNVGLSRFAFLPLPSLEARGKGKGRTVSAVRRLLIADLSGAGVREIGWAERAISGAELVPERRESCPPDGKNPNAAAPEAGEPESGESALKGAGPVAVLTSLGRSDDAVRRYTEAATTWTTVTPMLLPGFDDPRHLRRRMSREGASLSAADKQRLVAQLDERVENLIRKSIVHAGFPEALARGASIEWRKTGYLPGVELADRYFVPVKHRGYPRWHVNLTWRDASGEPLPLPGPLALGAGKFYGLGLFVGTDRM